MVHGQKLIWFCMSVADWKGNLSKGVGADSDDRRQSQYPVS